ncbi:hypothetical protein VP217E381_P0035 [Vibrio phage 217E38-1]|nr:hypothetical protein VP217E381_P0035 [Vibrio phage 217E38-1]
MIRNKTKYPQKHKQASSEAFLLPVTSHCCAASF